MRLTQTNDCLRFIVYAKIVVGSSHRFDSTHIREHVTQLPMIEVPVLLQVLHHAFSLLQELKRHILLSLLEEIHRLLVDFPDEPDFLKVVRNKTFKLHLKLPTR